MRTVIIIAAGLLLLGICLAAGRLLARPGTQAIITAAQVFIALWFVVAAINMWLGVSEAGYSVMEELPIFLAIFGIPAALAAFVWWRLS